jgi:NitT/TauT family transport system ATP-binding protein
VVEWTRTAAPFCIVFPYSALFPWRTAIENVEFGPMIQGLPRPERRAVARRYLALVGLEEHEDKYPRELSGGMKQRVAIARVLANHPSVLLMDEPFGALDAQTREVMQEELLRIWEQDKKTVVFVTPSISESIFLADRIVVMATRPGTIKEIVDVAYTAPALTARASPSWPSEREIKRRP